MNALTPGTPLLVTAADYRRHDDEYDGICTACGKTRIGMTEPDAREYRCDECGQMKVYGFAEALLMGVVDIVDEKEAA